MRTESGDADGRRNVTSDRSRGEEEKEDAVTRSDAQDRPVQAKAVLVDPETMQVIWMNESAAEPFADRTAGAVRQPLVAEAVPMAETLGVLDAVRAVAETGVARHLEADLVSTSRGAVSLVVSVYRLPDGMVLVLSEQAWHVERRRTEGRGGQPPRG